MNVCVYGVCRLGSLDVAGLPRGLFDGAVSPLCTDRLLALISPMPDGFSGHAPLSRASYERVLHTAHARTDVLPVRFPTLMTDDAVLSKVMRVREEELLAELGRREGLVELGLTLSGSSMIVTRAWRVRAPAFAGTGALAMQSCPDDETARGTDGLSGLLEDLRPFIEGVQAVDGRTARCLVRRELEPVFRIAFEEARSVHDPLATLSEAGACLSLGVCSLD